MCRYFILILELLAFLNCADRAGSDTCQAGDACIRVALGLSISVQCECRYRADTCAGAAADAIFLIYYNCHYVLPPLRSNYTTEVFHYSIISGTLFTAEPHCNGSAWSEMKNPCFHGFLFLFFSLLPEDVPES